MFKRIGDYDVRYEIGRGGFGCVYLGFDPRVQRLVAIKVLDSAADTNLITRFRTEASAAGNLRHKNIVTVYGYGEDEGRHFLIMEYLDGHDLHNLIRGDKPLTLLQKVDIMYQVAEGLLCAHRNGVVHRDIKPANVKVLADGSVKIMDFGIARLLRDGAARLTQAGLMVGTVSYMAPEQFENSQADVLCDIWAYGVIYYELLTGVNPFQAADLGSAMYKIASCNPEAIRSLCPDCPPALDLIVQRLLSKDRDNRYQSLDDVQFDVAPVLRGLQRKHAGALLNEASALWASGRRDEAAMLSRKILDLDPGNTQARELLESIQDEGRKRAVRLRVAALMRQAETEAERHNYEYAIRAADSALKLEPSVEILDFRNRMQAAWDQRKQAEQYVEHARTQWNANDPDGARQSLTSALAADPQNKDALRLMDQVRAAIRALERQNQLREALGQAQRFLETNALDEARGVLTLLKKEQPNSAEAAGQIQRLEREEERRRRHLREQIETAKREIKAGRLSEAIARLETIARDYPNENSVPVLLRDARERLRGAQQDLQCKRIVDAANQWVEVGEFERARNQVARGLEEFPGHPALLAAEATVQRAKSAYERERQIVSGVHRCREMHAQARFDDAITLIEELRTVYGDAPEIISEREALQREIGERDRERSVIAALECGRGLVEGSGPGVAAEFLRQCSASLGEDPRLRAFLNEVEAKHEEAEREKEASSLLARAAELESNGEYRPALSLLELGLERYGSIPEMLAAAGRIRERLSIAEQARGIEQWIQQRDWRMAHHCLQRAMAEHPSESIWQGYVPQVRAGQLEREIELTLASGDLDRAREKMEEARTGAFPLPSFGRLESDLGKAQARKQSLDQARTLTETGEFAQAEAVLNELLRQNSQDGDAIPLLRAAHERREKQEREARRQQTRAEAKRLQNEGKFEAASQIFRGLLKENRADPEVQEDLRLVKESQARAEREEAFSKTLAQAKELAAGGALDAATKKFRALLKEQPTNAEVERELAEVVAAREAQKRHQELLRQREQALRLVKDAEFAPALEMLGPLLREFPKDASLYEAWRTAEASRRKRSDWLRVYEEVTEIEALYRKGKAWAVKDRALRLLKNLEEPRVRQYLNWADELLAKEPPRRRLAVRIADSDDLLVISLGLITLIIVIFWLIYRFGPVAR
jgi:tRNA A-37 threonylcarbamoyl transferase component Bud32